MKVHICCRVILSLLRLVAYGGTYYVLESEDFAYLIIIFFILIAYLDFSGALTFVSISCFECSLHPPGYLLQLYLALEEGILELIRIIRSVKSRCQFL